MSPWLAPAVIELCLLALFATVIVSVRRTLPSAVIGLWIFVWILRGTFSLLGTNLAKATGGERVLFASLQCALGILLAGIAFRLESKTRIRLLEEEVRELRRRAAARMEIDPLTALSNRSALDRWLEEDTSFQGMIVVCDLDDFKVLNDNYGHLIGDEILRDIGQLVRASIRHDDRAFRWGGDEFVICFRTLDHVLVEDRLQTLEERLKQFQLRNHGPVCLRFSWGVSSVTPGRSLRDALHEADKRMYEFKRQRRLRLQNLESTQP